MFNQIFILYSILNDNNKPNLDALYQILQLEGLEQFIGLNGLSTYISSLLLNNGELSNEQIELIRKRLISLIVSNYQDENSKKINELLSKNDEYIIQRYTYKPEQYQNVIWKSDKTYRGSLLLPNFPSIMKDNYGEYIFERRIDSPFIYDITFTKKKMYNGYFAKVDDSQIAKNIFLMTSYNQNVIKTIKQDKEDVLKFELDMTLLFRTIRSKYIDSLSFSKNKNIQDPISSIEKDNNIIVDIDRFSIMIRPSIPMLHFNFIDRLELYDYELHIPTSYITLFQPLLSLFKGTTSKTQDGNFSYFKTDFSNKLNYLKRNNKPIEVEQLINNFFMHRYLIEQKLQDYLYNGELFIFDSPNNDEKKYNLEHSYENIRSNQITFKFGGIVIDEDMMSKIDTLSKVEPSNEINDIGTLHNSIIYPVFFNKIINKKQGKETKKLVYYRAFPFLKIKDFNGDPISNSYIPPTNFIFTNIADVYNVSSKNNQDIFVINYVSNIQVKDSFKTTNLLLKGLGNIDNLPMGDNLYLIENGMYLIISYNRIISDEDKSKKIEFYKKRNFDVKLLGSSISTTSNIDFPVQTFSINIKKENQRVITDASTCLLRIKMLKYKINMSWLNNIEEKINEYTSTLLVDDTYHQEILKNKEIPENLHIDILNTLYKRVKDPSMNQYIDEINKVVCNEINLYFEKSIENIRKNLLTNSIQNITSHFERDMINTINFSDMYTEPIVNEIIYQLKNGIFLDEKNQVIAFLNSLIGEPLDIIILKLQKFDHYSSVISRIIIDLFDEPSSYEEYIISKLMDKFNDIGKYQMFQLSQYEYIFSTTSEYEMNKLEFLTPLLDNIIFEDITGYKSNNKITITEYEYDTLYHQMYYKFEINTKDKNIIKKLFEEGLLSYEDLNIFDLDFIIFGISEETGKELCYLPKIYLGKKLNYIDDDRLLFLCNFLKIEFKNDLKTMGKLILDKTTIDIRKPIHNFLIMYNGMTNYMNELLSSMPEFDDNIKTYCYDINKNDKIFSLSFIIPRKFLILNPSLSSIIFSIINFSDFNNIIIAINKFNNYDNVYENLIPLNFLSTYKDEKIIVNSKNSVSMLKYPDIFDQTTLHNIYLKDLIHENFFKDIEHIDYERVQNKNIRLEYELLEDEIDIFMNLYQSSVNDTKITLSTNTTKWVSENISNLSFNQNDKPLWKELSSDYLALGYENGIKLYSIVDKIFVLIDNYEHIGVSKIIFGKNGFFITIQDSDNSIPYAKLWNISSGEIMCFTFTDIRIGDIVSSLVQKKKDNKLITSTETNIISAIDKGKYYNLARNELYTPKLLSNNNIFLFSYNSKYIACNGKGYRNIKPAKINSMFSIYNSNGDIVFDTDKSMERYSWSKKNNTLVSIENKLSPNVYIFTEEFLNKSHQIKNDQSFLFKYAFPETNIYDTSNELYSMKDNTKFINFANNRIHGLWFCNIFITYSDNIVTLYDRNNNEWQNYEIYDFNKYLLSIEDDNGYVIAMKYEDEFIYPFSDPISEILNCPLIKKNNITFYYVWFEDRLFSWYYEENKTIINVYLENEMKTIIIYNNYYIIPSYNNITIIKNNIFDTITLDKMFIENSYEYLYPTTIISSKITKEIIYTNPKPFEVNVVYPFTSFLVNDIKDNVPILSYSLSKDEIKRISKELVGKDDYNILVNENVVTITSGSKMYILSKTFKIKNAKNLKNQYDYYQEKFNNFQIQKYDNNILYYENKEYQTFLIDFQNRRNNTHKKLLKLNDENRRLEDENNEYQDNIKKLRKIDNENKRLENRFKNNKKFENTDSELESFQTEKNKEIEDIQTLLKLNNRKIAEKNNLINILNEELLMLDQINENIENDSFDIYEPLYIDILQEKILNTKNKYISSLDEIKAMVDIFIVNLNLPVNISVDKINSDENITLKFKTKPIEQDIDDIIYKSDLNLFDLIVKNSRNDINSQKRRLKKENDDYYNDIFQLENIISSNEKNEDVLKKALKELKSNNQKIDDNNNIIINLDDELMTLNKIKDDDINQIIFTSPVKSYLNGFKDSSGKYVPVFYLSEKYNNNNIINVKEKMPLFTSISNSTSSINSLPIIDFNNESYLIKWTNVVKNKDNGYTYVNKKIGVLMIYNLNKNGNVTIISPSNENCDKVSNNIYDMNVYGEYEKVWFEEDEVAVRSNKNKLEYDYVDIKIEKSEKIIKYKYVGSDIVHSISLFFLLNEEKNNENVSLEIKSRQEKSSGKFKMGHNVFYKITDYITCSLPSIIEQNLLKNSNINIVWCPSGEYFCLWYTFNYENKYNGTSLSIYSLNSTLIFEKKLLMYEAHSIILQFTEIDKNKYYDVLIGGIGQGFPGKKIRIGKFQYLKTDKKTTEMWETRKIVNCFDEENVVVSFMDRKIESLKMFKMVSYIIYFVIYTDENNISFLRIKGIDSDKLIKLNNNPIDISLSRNNTFCSIIYEDRSEIWNILGELVEVFVGNAKFNE